MLDPARYAITYDAGAGTYDFMPQIKGVYELLPDALSDVLRLTVEVRGDTAFYEDSWRVAPYLDAHLVTFLAEGADEIEIMYHRRSLATINLVRLRPYPCDIDALLRETR